MSNTEGYIYILTNSFFPPYVKIGYANNVEARVKKLNQTECAPLLDSEFTQNTKSIQG